MEHNYQIYYLQPFFSWGMHLLIFLFAIGLKRFVFTNSLKQKPSFLKLINKIIIGVFALVAIYIYVLGLIFDTTFKNVFVEEIFFLIVFLVLDFSIIPFLTDNYDSVKQKIKLDGYKSVGRKILFPHLYLKLRWLYFYSILIRLPLSVATLFLNVTLSYPSYSYYWHEDHQVYLDNHSYYKGDYKVGYFYVPNIPFFYDDTQFAVSTKDNLLFRHYVFRGESLKHILCYTFDIDETLFVKIGEFKRKKDFPKEIINEFYQDSIFYSNFSKTNKLNVYFRVDTKNRKMIDGWSYFYYLSYHEITEDSLNLNLTKGKNLKDVSEQICTINYDGPGVQNKVFIPNYIDFKVK